MGHAREDVFKHYIHRTVQVDTQVAFLGNPLRMELVAGMSRMGTSRDANAHTSLTAEQYDEIDRDPRLIALQIERSKLVSQIKCYTPYSGDHSTALGFPRDGIAHGITLAHSIHRHRIHGTVDAICTGGRLTPRR